MKKTLLEHCDVKYEYDSNDREYTKIIVNKDIENIICNFNLGYIDRTNNKNWYPSDLFTKVFINCIEKNNIKVVQRKKI